MAAIPADREVAILLPDDFRELFTRYYPGVCRQLRAILGDAAAAEDLAQETFLKLYCNPPREKGNIGGWLHRVALNMAYKYMRREEIRRRRELRASTTEVEESWNPSFLRRQEIREVQEILEGLPPRDRLCLMLRFSGYSYKEIAGVIGVDVRSVGTILARARVKFRQAYDRQEGNSGVLR